MRRSSTTRSGPTTRRRLQGEKLLHHSTETTSPSNPATMRMIPTVCRSNPEVPTSTAKVRIAPITNRKRLKPIPPLCLPSTLRRSSQSRPFGRLLRPRQEETAASSRTLHIATSTGRSGPSACSYAARRPSRPCLLEYSARTTSGSSILRRQDRRAPEAATRRLAAEPRVQCRADSANSPLWVAPAAFLDVESHPPAWRGDMLVRMRQPGWTQSSGSPAP